jgi:alpha-1,2-mannosyltransferase
LWGTQAWTVAYIYPPFFALVLAPLTSLGLVAAGRIWLILIQLTFITALWLILRISPELSKSARRVFLLASFVFMPVYLNLKFQQVATLWLLLLTAALWAGLARRSRLTGLFIAVAASLKVVPIFLIPLFARLRRWSVVLYSSVLLVVITGVSLVISPDSVQFFTEVLPRIGLGNSNWDNGSITGLVSRFVAFYPSAFGGSTALLAKALILVGIVAILGLTLWMVPSRDGPWMLRLGTASLVTALLMVSSVTWQHHLVVLLLPIAVAMAWIQARRPGALYGFWLAAGYALCWLDRRAFPLPADQAVHSSGQALMVLAGTSIKLAGLTLIWVLLLRMLRLERSLAVRQPRATAEPAAPSAA